MIGDFGNPDYDPFDDKSPKTLRELALSQGKQIQTKTTISFIARYTYIFTVLYYVGKSCNARKG